jgi:hypothetical protein
VEVYYSSWHLVSSVGLFVVGGVFSVLIARNFSCVPARAFAIYLWHTFFSMLYLWYALVYGGDAIGYFQDGSATRFDGGFGGGSVTYLVGFLVFNFFGVVGLLAFDASLRVATQKKPKRLRYLANAIIFLPSVSFWSSAIGKDSVSFMSATLALWAALSLSRRWILMAFAVAVMMLVRPHMAGMMVMAWAAAIIMSRDITIVKKVSLAVLSGFAALLMVPFALQYAGVDEAASFVDLMVYIDQRQEYNMEGGASVDIANMSLPMQMFVYMFRPFIFEVNSIFSLFAAIDNFILLCLFSLGGWAIFLGRKSGLGESRVFMWAYVLMAWVVLASTTANLGISLRQKWMFVPMLIFLVISTLGVVKHKNVVRFYSDRIRLSSKR